MICCKTKRFPLILALIQWIVTTVFQVDRAFFTYYHPTLYFFLTKIFYLCFLRAAWSFAFQAYNKIRCKDEAWMRGRFIFCSYLGIMLLLLLLFWPGTWTFDDLWTLVGISSYTMWSPWQHVLSGAYQDVLLQILPFPAGIIFLQNVIISLCVAFTVVKLEQILKIPVIKNKILDTGIKVLPFLLPPVIMYQFSGYRIGLYVYLELVMIVILIDVKRSARQWDLSYLLLFVFLCVIVSTWRTESFVYIPVISILLFSLPKSIVANRKKFMSVILILIGVFGISKFQSWALGDANYEVMSLMRPCAELVRNADPVADADDLKAIDKVASVKVIMDNPWANGEFLYWTTPCIRNRNEDPSDDFTPEEYRRFQKAIVRLALKYPKVVIIERLNLFIDGSGINGKSTANVEFTSKLYDLDNGNEAARRVLEKGWFASYPPSIEFRKAFIRSFGMINGNNSFIAALRRIIWNAIIPELVLIYAWMKVCFKKEWYYFGILTAILSKLGIVVLTQPSNWFMYVLSFYLLGYVLAIFWGLSICKKLGKT